MRLCLQKYQFIFKYSSTEIESMRGLNVLKYSSRPLLEPSIQNYNCVSMEAFAKISVICTSTKRPLVIMFPWIIYQTTCFWYRIKDILSNLRLYSRTFWSVENGRHKGQYEPRDVPTLGRDTLLLRTFVRKVEPGNFSTPIFQKSTYSYVYTYI